MDGTPPEQLSPAFSWSLFAAFLLSCFTFALAGGLCGVCCPRSVCPPRPHVPISPAMGDAHRSDDPCVSTLPEMGCVVALPQLMPTSAFVQEGPGPSEAPPGLVAALLFFVSDEKGFSWAGSSRSSWGNLCAAQCEAMLWADAVTAPFGCSAAPAITAAVLLASPMVSNSEGKAWEFVPCDKEEGLAAGKQ